MAENEKFDSPPEETTGFDAEIRSNTRILNEIEPSWREKPLNRAQIKAFKEKAMQGADGPADLSHPHKVRSYTRWLKSVEDDDNSDRAKRYQPRAGVYEDTEKRRAPK